MNDGKVAAAVVVDNGRVLLVRRAVAEGRLSWQFPAGKFEPSESGEQAAVRETFEETGLAVRPIGSLGERVHPDTGRVMIYVACEMVGGAAHVASNEEVAEVVWCDRDSLMALVPYPIYEPAQRYLDDRLRSGERRALGG
ncbi:NUDIX hydrolase [Actinoplanes sp. NPDC026619]|uniref:NUDIX hydrolase n=1 Tax=Actinoplanes sp. NPDC026619 TaxID=3155798 RepID=UPI0033D2CF20